MECIACRLKRCKIKKCQTKQNVVNLKKTVKSKQEIWEEISEALSSDVIDMVCYATQKEAEEIITQINKGVEWHGEMYQNRYTEINEDRYKKANGNDNNEESKKNKTSNERQNHQSGKGMGKW